MASKIFFSDDVKDYMLLNGFNLLDNKGLHDGMLWHREGEAVYFWQNRIEYQQKNALGDYQLKNTYIGFDGHNEQHLIMILHCMGVITIDSAVKLAAEQDGNVNHIGKILMSMPITQNLTNRS